MRTVRSLLRPVFTCLPNPVQHWIRSQRFARPSVRQNIAAVRQGDRLVPEEALERRYIEALRLLTRSHPAGSLGDYLEFGVYNGSSLACAFRALSQVGERHARLFGFDSFEGLPADAEGEGVWKEGEFRMDEKFTREFLTERGVDWDRVTLIKGWFSETLNDQTRRRHSIRKVSLIMVDCDIYASTKPALAFCAPLIGDEAVVFFDDWFSGGLADRNEGEKRAFDEFLSAHPEFKAEDFGDYGWNSKAFVLSRVAGYR
jgi:O-methyltransferase